MKPLRPYAAALAAAALLLAGCGGDEKPKADPSTPPAGSDSASPSATPTVEPATGKVLRNNHFSTRAPEGWSVRHGMSTSILSTVYAADEQPDGSVSGFLSIADGPALVDDSLAQLAREKAASDEFERAPKVLDPIEVDGTEAYQIAGKVNRSTYVIAIGTIHDDKLVELHVESDVRSPEEVQEIVDSVLAAWHWA